MSFNINRFKQNLDSYGYARNNKFEVFVHTPKFLQGKYIKINNRETNVSRIGDILRYRINQASVPRVDLVSLDTNRYGIGPTQKMPYTSMFQDISISVLVDRNTKLWDFWYVWLNSIVSFNGQEPTGNNIFTGGRIPSYTVEYKDEYSTTMSIVIYEETGRIIKTVNLYEAFPSSITGVQLSWLENSSLIQLGVSITYSNYTVEGASLNSNEENVDPYDFIPPKRNAASILTGAINSVIGVNDLINLF